MPHHTHGGIHGEHRASRAWSWIVRRVTSQHPTRRPRATIDEQTAPLLAAAVLGEDVLEADAAGPAAAADEGASAPRKTPSVWQSGVYGVAAATLLLTLRAGYHGTPAANAAESQQDPAQHASGLGSFPSVADPAAPTSGRGASSSAQPPEEDPMHRTIRNVAATAVGSLALTAGAAAQAVEWRVADGGNGHWYQMLANPNGDLHWLWSDAQAFATASGGHLATLTSPSESAAAYNLVGIAATTRTAWIGLYQPPGSLEPAGGWRWVTNEASGYQNWKPGQPGDAGCSIPGNHQDYAIIGGGGDNQWDDHGDPTPNCRFDVRSAIIEWSADCNNDGIVVYGQIRAGQLPDFNGNNIPDCCDQGVPCTVGNYPTQWREADGGNGHWYAALRPASMPTTFAAQDAYATALGAHMATLSSAAENALAISLLDSTIGQGGAFFGYRRVGNTSAWRFVDGQAATWTFWGSASCGAGPYPNNSGLAGEMSCHLYRRADCGWVWDDTPATEAQSSPTLKLLIEWSADCNNDGIVDYGQIRTGQLPDQNANNIPDTCECAAHPELAACCPGDLNHDSQLNGADVGVLLAFWGEVTANTPAGADINRDGVVNGADLGVLLSRWGPCGG